MGPYVERIVRRLHEAEDDLTREAEEQQKRWQYTLRRGRVWFDEEVHRRHLALRQRIPAFLRESSIAAILTAPVIYSVFLPFAILDAWVTLYQWVCFPIYGIALVPRRRYIPIDRYRLSYLNEIEKANCTYCSYANGLIAYVREVAARTEQYWCPIKHSRPIPTPHAHYHVFFDYGDATSYRRELPAKRDALRPNRDTRE